MTGHGTSADQERSFLPFYGVGGYDQVDLSQVTAPVLGHFGSEDGFAPPAQVDALEEVGR